MAKVFLAMLFLACLSRVHAKDCGFSPDTLKFAGTELEQARCLLRPSLPLGRLGPALNPLPIPFESLVGKSVNIDKQKFLALLDQRQVARDGLGGSINEPLSSAPGLTHPQARYFVIHDTSDNTCDDQTAFEQADDPNYRFNSSKQWEDEKNAHLYITRDGKLVSPTGVTFASPRYATKLDFKKYPNAIGVFIHIENVQARRAKLAPGQAAKVLDAHTGNLRCANDFIAQSPGFTERQMELLALAYIAASIRGNRWMIPAYHVAVDDGISDAHDDPQNFDLAAWGQMICNDLRSLGQPCS
jgi:hypothetical protein